MLVLIAIFLLLLRYQLRYVQAYSFRTVPRTF